MEVLVTFTSKAIPTSRWSPAACTTRNTWSRTTCRRTRPARYSRPSAHRAAVATTSCALRGPQGPGADLHPRPEGLGRERRARPEDPHRLSADVEANSTELKAEEHRTTQGPQDRGRANDYGVATNQHVKLGTGQFVEAGNETSPLQRPQGVVLEARRRAHLQGRPLHQAGRQRRTPWSARRSRSARTGLAVARARRPSCRVRR